MRSAFTNLKSDIVFPDAQTESKQCAKGDDADLRRFAGRFDVFCDLNEVEKIWTDIQKDGVATPYQSFHFAKAWFSNIAQSFNIKPFVIAAYDEDGRPALLLPFAVKPTRFGSIAYYIGGKHSNLNMPIQRRRFAITTASLSCLLQTAAQRARNKVDAYILLNQPEAWMRAPNPFKDLFTQESASNAYSVAMGDDLDAFFNLQRSKSARKKFRAKLNKLQELGKIVIERAATADRSRVLLSTLISQKNASFAQKGKQTALSHANARAFLENLLAQNSDGDDFMELYALTANGEVLAVYGGMPERNARWGEADAWHAMLNSYNPDPKFARFSPGEVLMREVLCDLHRRGFRRFELGVGEARYKSSICNETLYLKDAIIVATWRGAIIAAAQKIILKLKKRVKQNPYLYAIAQKILK